MPAASFPPLPRKDFPPGTDACTHCTGRCCRYFALPVDEPTEARDFDFLRWYLLHGNCAVFADGDAWFLMVHGDCEHLLPDHRCGIYETRPDICRAYSNESCEDDGDGRHDRLFECPEQLAEYARAVLPQHKPPKADRDRIHAGELAWHDASFARPKTPPAALAVLP